MRFHFKYFAALFFLLTCIFSPSPAQADFFEPSAWTEQQTYSEKISHKLGFGFLNISSGWTALWFEPHYDENYFAGLAKGIAYTITNTAGGILHAATFPIPLDIPIPHGGIAYEYKRKK